MTNQEGVLTITDDGGEVVAIVRKDEKTHHNLIYTVCLANLGEIERLLKGVPISQTVVDGFKKVDEGDCECHCDGCYRLAHCGNTKCGFLSNEK